MTGATPAAAAGATPDALQVLLSTVSNVVLRTDATGPSILLTARDRLVRRSGGHLGLFVLHAFSPVSDAARPRSERWQARTVGYQYRLEDGDGREIIAYHWHPQGQSHVSVPHLHLGAALGALRPEMLKAHLHTGVVSPVAVLTLAVEQFEVAPRRTDWAGVFNRIARDLAHS
jgi:hypothetical protein